MKILLVEDDSKVAAFIKRGLQENNYQVDLVYNGLDGEKMIRQHDYDLAIFDVLLPGQSGIELCRKIRSLDFLFPVLMLSALGTTGDKVTGLDAGADDYIVKPFEFKELLARVRALLRRKTRDAESNELKIANLEINLTEKTVRRNQKHIQLTAREWELLVYLVRKKGQVISRVEIEEQVWNMSFSRESNIVDVYINFLRKKIDKEFEPRLIHTIVGMGYAVKIKE
jgi:two-component system, OmpR family, copper resistance phosphate regulon response regulator CusR